MPNYLFVHSHGTMEPRDLLQALLDRDEENPSTLAAKLKKADPETKATQPQIHKFLTGKAREPRRSTLEPLASHFGVPVEAFYDPATAARVAAALKLTESGEPVRQAAAVEGELSAQARQLLKDFGDLVDEDEKRQILEHVAARAVKARALREKVRAEMLAEYGLAPDEKETPEDAARNTETRRALDPRRPSPVRKRPA